MAKTASSLKGYHHIAWRAKDFDASLHFYIEALGCTIFRIWGEGNSRGVLLDIGNTNYLEILAGSATEPKPEGVLIHLALATDDCDAAMQRALAAGAELYIAPKMLTLDSQPEPLNVRNAFFKGPDGEVVEFFQTLDAAE